MPLRGSRVEVQNSPLNWYKYWWLGPILLVVAFLAWTVTGPEWSRPRTGKTSDTRPLPGYIGDFNAVQQEYQRYYGKPLRDDFVRSRFDAATRAMSGRDFGAAAQVLEELAKVAAIPAVYNNLGVIYLAQNDRGNAVNAFREALSRDTEYLPVRQNMDRMKDIGLENAGPLLHEIESNNTLILANVIAPGKPVQAEIMAAVNDIDTFKVTTPPAPRDILSIEVAPRSTLFRPMFKIFDGEHRMLDWLKNQNAPGKPVATTLSPEPNSTLFVQVIGFADSAGLYTLKVQPKKAFDAFEPNDDVYSATDITLGAQIVANIMDGRDTDFYAFEPLRAGQVTVRITNHSQTLVPAVTTFTPDRRSSGFGPDVATPGASLEHSFEVEAKQKYFIQVWSKADTAGDYMLWVTQ